MNPCHNTFSAKFLISKLEDSVSNFAKLSNIPRNVIENRVLVKTLITKSHDNDRVQRIIYIVLDISRN
jgi:hypothetical protein